MDGEGRQSFSIQLTRRWGFGELDGAEVDGFDGFAGLEISAARSELGEDGGVREQGFAGGESSSIGTIGFQFGSAGDGDDVEWGGLGLVVFGELPSGVVILVALGVDYEMDFSALAVGGRVGSEDFGAGNGEKVDISGKLPALGGGDGGADAGVAAGADADADSLDGGRIEAGFC